ncbi:MAG: hypothetical protein ACI8UO_004965 [Verrucomicrobiales bacterium]|jgi:hypothetical protein
MHGVEHAQALKAMQPSASENRTGQQEPGVILFRQSTIMLQELSRRSSLKIGALGVGTLGLGSLMRLRAASEQPKTRPKSVIMVYLPGGSSHIDMYDMKPDAPTEYRGEFRPISTNVPGMQICELMPEQARIADKFSILRGLRTRGNHDPTELLTGIHAAASGRIGPRRRSAASSASCEGLKARYLLT